MQVLIILNLELLVLFLARLHKNQERSIYLRVVAATTTNCRRRSRFPMMDLHNQHNQLSVSNMNITFPLRIKYKPLPIDEKVGKIPGAKDVMIPICCSIGDNFGLCENLIKDSFFPNWGLFRVFRRFLAALELIYGGVVE